MEDCFWCFSKYLKLCSWSLNFHYDDMIVQTSVFFLLKFFFLQVFFCVSDLINVAKKFEILYIVFILNTNLGFLFNVSFFCSQIKMRFSSTLCEREKKNLKENRICVVVIYWLICREIVYCKAPILYSKQILIKLQALRIKWQKLVANVGT